MMREPVVARSTTTPSISSAPPTNAIGGTSSMVVNDSATETQRSGVSASADTTAVRGPLLGTSSARVITARHANMSETYAEALSSGASSALSANAAPMPIA